MIKQRIETEQRVAHLNDLHRVDKETMDMILKSRKPDKIKKEVI